MKGLLRLRLAYSPIFVLAMHLSPVQYCIQPKSLGDGLQQWHRKMKSDTDRPQSRHVGTGVTTLGLEEAARLARCHPDTLRKLAKARVVPATKIGREWVFHREVFQEWIDGPGRSIVPHAL